MIVKQEYKFFKRGGYGVLYYWKELKSVIRFCKMYENLDRCFNDVGIQEGWIVIKKKQFLGFIISLLNFGYVEFLVMIFMWNLYFL